MPKYLVMVKPAPHESFSVGFPRQMRPTLGYSLPTVSNREDYDTNDFGAFEVDGVDVSAFMDHLSFLRPGREVCVYELTQVAVRPPGDLVVKKISEKGVLPT